MTLTALTGNRCRALKNKFLGSCPECRTSNTSACDLLFPVCIKMQPEKKYEWKLWTLPYHKPFPMLCKRILLFVCFVITNIRSQMFSGVRFTGWMDVKSELGLGGGQGGMASRQSSNENTKHSCCWQGANTADWLPAPSSLPSSKHKENPWWQVSFILHYELD